MLGDGVHARDNAKLQAEIRTLRGFCTMLTNIVFKVVGSH